jgi:uncharacterized membrane protein YfcA
MIVLIWVSLAGLTVWFLFVFGRDVIRHKEQLRNVSWLKTGLIGFLVNFFDVLGIGAFAPQTALLKFTGLAEDREIPGTLNVSNALPVLLQALIFITVIEVEPVTLILLLVSAAGGAVLGAGIVAKLPERKIRLTIGVALLVTAFFMFAGKMNWVPGGGEAIGLEGTKLVVAISINFVLGAFMTAGIGLYAPCMALVFSLGMSPKVAFPIMMGSCAFLMPPASAKFIREGAYNRMASIGMVGPSIVAVLIAAFIVKSMDLDLLRWVVIGVILYTSVIMLRAVNSRQ